MIGSTNVTWIGYDQRRVEVRGVKRPILSTSAVYKTHLSYFFMCYLFFKTCWAPNWYTLGYHVCRRRYYDAVKYTYYCIVTLVVASKTWIHARILMCLTVVIIIGTTISVLVTCIYSRCMWFIPDIIHNMYVIHTRHFTQDVCDSYPTVYTRCMWFIPEIILKMYVIHTRDYTQDVCDSYPTLYTRCMWFIPDSLHEMYVIHTRD